jgi:hypothetical protein
MKRITKVKILENYKLWLKFADGAEGIVDLSKLVGKGVFKKWKDRNFFESVKINPQTGTLTWGEEIDLCSDTLYAEILKVNPIEVLRNKETIKK